jgi:Fe-S cluster biogenesis protein NfuA
MRDAGSHDLVAMAAPLKTDAPFYTEAELDQLEATDAVAAVRIAREQLLLKKRLLSQVAVNAAGPMPQLEELEPVIDEVRSILRRDGGDIELVGLELGILTVRLKGSCSGCPRAPLDLKQVVETLVRGRYPQITAVRNLF